MTLFFWGFEDIKTSPHREYHTNHNKNQPQYISAPKSLPEHYPACCGNQNETEGHDRISLVEIPTFQQEDPQKRECRVENDGCDGVVIEGNVPDMWAWRQCLGSELEQDLSGRNSNDCQQ